MRQIILDTETTGLEPKEGHNIIEIGCVEMVKRKLTGRTYHQYVKPDRDIDAEAMAVHGITNEFLLDKPKFAAVMYEFLNFIRGAELIIHNAAFDIGFIDEELKRCGIDDRVADLCTITDSLAIARKKHPGQKNNLDALCRRYGIDNSHRELHGALLDSEILADVYLMLTGGQTALLLDANAGGDLAATTRLGPVAQADLLVPRATNAELEQHESFVALLDKKSGGESLWTRLAKQNDTLH